MLPDSARRRDRCSGTERVGDALDEVARHTGAEGRGPQRTPHTVTARGRLDDELARVREQGYASEYEEADESVCSIAAPVLDRDGYPRAAVSVSSLTFLVTEEQLRTFAPAVCDTATEVARRL